MPSEPDLDGELLDIGDDDELLTGEAVALDLHPVGFALRAAGGRRVLLLYQPLGVL